MYPNVIDVVILFVVLVMAIANACISQTPYGRTKSTSV